MPAYFYEKLTLQCPACDAILTWSPRSVFSKHPDRMSLTHAADVKLADGKTLCPNAGKTYFAPGIELTEIPADGR
jgi:hypothetical protein